jgi:hypothetical protein
MPKGYAPLAAILDFKLPISSFERSRPAADASREANGSVIAKHVG